MNLIQCSRKLKKLIQSPGVFFKDYFNKKYPEIYNEIQCPKSDESILIKHDLELENQIVNNFPIDVVFTWVDNSDIKWQRKYDFFKNKNIDSQGQYATDLARFSNHNELYYAVKSVRENLSWVRNIYIVTDKQCPSWISEFFDIYVIDHTEIIDEKYLPTFNSHVIEAHLHLIPELSEHFIYFNDDVFVARKLSSGHFFRSETISSLFISKKSLNDMQARGILTPTLSASLKAKALLEKKFSYFIDITLVHTYVPLRKSIYEKVWAEYGSDITGFLDNRFRTNNDLNLATFLVPWFSYCTGYAVPVRDICYYFNIRSPSAKKYYQVLSNISKDERPHSFCANDFTSVAKKTMENYQASLINNLDIYFYRESE